MSPFFSVIIPTYNRALLIPKAIDSVIAQTYKDWELIIVDDGSKDNTRQVVEQYVDPRIRYIYQQNAERSMARNNGIDHSTGRYVCFLDSDDYYFDNRLQLLYDELNRQAFPVAFFYTGLVFSIDDKLTKRGERKRDENIGDWITIAAIHSQQTCISSEILKEFKFDKRFHIGEDMELWLRIAAKYPFIYLDNQFSVVTVEHDDRSINVVRFNIFVDQLRMFRFAFKPPHPGQHISTGTKDLLVANAFYGIAKFNIYNNMRGGAIIAMLNAIITDTRTEQFKFRINILLKLVAFAPMSKVRELIKY